MENHPDRAIARGLPQEFIDLATEKLASINDAYDRICRHRGFN
jgi:DnaJ like chaperone protein